MCTPKIRKKKTKIVHLLHIVVNIMSPSFLIKYWVTVFGKTALVWGE